MSVLDRAALEDSPLADLHAIASELSIDGYRRLRRADLIAAILERQGGGDGLQPSDEEPAIQEPIAGEAAVEEAEAGEPDGEEPEAEADVRVEEAEEVRAEAREAEALRAEAREAEEPSPED